MRLWKCGVVGMMMLGVGCGPADSDMDSESGLTEGVVQADSVQVVSQGLTTRSITLSFPQTPAVYNPCGFGTGDNQAPRNSYASGRREDPVVRVTGLDGQRIHSMSLTTQGATFRYDDTLLLTYGHLPSSSPVRQLVFASDNRVPTYMTGLTLSAIGTSPVRYSWASLLNQHIGNFGHTPWCATGSGSCSMPSTEAAGALSISIADTRRLDEDAYPGAPDERQLHLVTAGDDNYTTDCVHSNINMTLTLQYQPVLFGTSVLGGWHAQAWGMDIQNTGLASLLRKPSTSICGIGRVVFDDIVQQSCTTANQCTYTATRYDLAASGSTCQSSVTRGVRLQQRGALLDEFDSATSTTPARTWNRTLGSSEPILGQWNSAQWGVNLFAQGYGTATSNPRSCPSFTYYDNVIKKTSCPSGYSSCYDAKRAAWASTTGCGVTYTDVELRYNGTVMEDWRNGTKVLTWNR
jgi:hypothetical protein